MSDGESVYLVRAETGAREDYWPKAACRTLEGAKEACAEYLKEQGLEMAEDVDGRSERIPYLRLHASGASVFVEVMPLGA